MEIFKGIDQDERTQAVKMLERTEKSHLNTDRRVYIV